MRAFWTARTGRTAPEGGAFGIALTRIRLAGEGWAAAEAEAAFRQVLGEGARPDLARRSLERIAAGPDPRAALIAAGALRMVAAGEAAAAVQSDATDATGSARK
ncbi:hypothetical protein [Paragemmobacter straminiformis]|uniref:Uncharacterized protein n=1 Tax=Paragemmobacter straminiformis TaxID=2045119 RepID=A0A842I9U2_9RHOB|nr:hypothetical protein [Gemmobacter straminiformis]MBC2836812.1 hypothetical protein [Gemmobacter straminiformis]